jgi:hypothetical protein
MKWLIPALWRWEELFIVLMGTVEKVPPLLSTPKSPKGDLLKNRELKSPLRGYGGKHDFFNSP